MLPPRLLIAAPSSGTGKTSVSIALCRAFSRKGVMVSPFKAGPDFLDPTHLAKAANAPCYNLDTWMMGPDYVTALAGKTTGEIAIMEGVMGLFDGAAPGQLSGSSAEIAQKTRTPVVLVVNAHGMAGSIAALVKGFASFCEGVEIQGVIANQVGSSGHGKILATALDAAGLPPLLGAIQRGAFPSLPSRHLGLVPADADPFHDSHLDLLADALEAHVDLDRIFSVAKKAPVFSPPQEKASPFAGKPAATKPVPLAVARDAAFHFYYEDTLEALEDAGFTLCFFSPLTDTRLPDAAGIFIGGGYPEVHARTLEENTAMRFAIQEKAMAGMPVYAECGGLMYLGKTLLATEGSAHAMCDVLPFSTRMLPKRKMLGYVEVTLSQDTLFGPPGTRIRGHEFHYSEIICPEGLSTAYKIQHRRTGTIRDEGYVTRQVLASYAHLHLASHPETIQHFLARCRAFAAGEDHALT